MFNTRTPGWFASGAAIEKGVPWNAGATHWLSCSDSAIPVFRLGPSRRMQSSKVAAVKGKAVEKPRKRGSGSVSRKEMQEMTQMKRGKQEVSRYTRWAPPLQRRGRKPIAGTLSTLLMTPILSAASAGCPLKPSQQPELPSVYAGIWVTLNGRPASVLWKLARLAYLLRAPVPLCVPPTGH